MAGKRRSILITGGTGKIGLILVEKMVLDGHNVIFTSTSLDKANRLIDSLGNIPSKLEFSILNLKNIDLFDEWVAELPFKIDTVIHNARNLDSLRIEKDGLTSPENLINEYEMSIVSPYVLTNKLIEANNPIRDVIFISSIYGLVAPNITLYDDFHHQSPIQYGIGKAAQLHIVKELAVRYAEKSIRVNAISYGGVEGRASKEFVERYNMLAPSGRMLNKNDLYPPIQMILNNMTLNITGENLKIDGGWTIW